MANRINLTAKRKNTRQKELTSQQKEKKHMAKRINLTAKRKRLTAKRITSWQKEKPHGNKKNLTTK